MADIESFNYQPPNWLDQLQLDEIFPSDQPLHIDLGCGKGRFLAGMAEENPNINFLGIDRLLRRIRKVNKKLIKSGAPNVRLLRIEGAYAVEYLLPPGSVSTFYIFFPDPWPKRKHHKNRLFNSSFMDLLVKCLADNGIVNVATDNAPYYEVIYELFRSDKRFEQIETFEPKDEHRTEFEQGFMDEGLIINRSSFRVIK